MLTVKEAADRAIHEAGALPGADSHAIREIQM